MDQATYSIEHAKTARSKCKQCKVEIDKDQLRIGKHFPSERFTEGGSATEWRHPACLFQHLKRVKKTTKKVETEADLSGFVLLDESEQAEIRALIAAKDVPSPKKPKAKKAAAAPKSPVVPVASAPPPDLFVCVLEPVADATEGASALKTLELGAGVHQLGRGETTGIDVKAVSRVQVELHVKADDHSVVFVRKGTNVSRLLRAGRDPLDAVVDQPYVLADGDQFALLGDQFRYAVKTVVKSPPKAAVAVPAASVPTPAASLPPLGTPASAGGKELPAWMTTGASAPPTTTAAASATPAVAKATKPTKPKAAAAKTTSLEPAKKKAKTTKKKKKDDDEEEDANEPNTYDLEDSFIDDDVPDEPPARDDGSDSDDSDADVGAGASKKRAASKISTVHHGDNNGDDDDDDDGDEDLGELAREARAFVKSGGITTSLPPCRYGAKCYRTNADHLADFSHPPREVDMAAIAITAAKLVPELSVDERIDGLAKVYTHIERDVIRDVLAEHGNVVSQVTEHLAAMDEAAAEH